MRVSSRRYRELQNVIPYEALLLRRVTSPSKKGELGELQLEELSMKVDNLAGKIDELTHLSRKSRDISI